MQSGDPQGWTGDPKPHSASRTFTLKFCFRDKPLSAYAHEQSLRSIWFNGQYESYMHCVKLGFSSR